MVSSDGDSIWLSLMKLVDRRDFKVLLCLLPSECDRWCFFYVLYCSCHRWRSALLYNWIFTHPSDKCVTKSPLRMDISKRILPIRSTKPLYRKQGEAIVSFSEFVCALEERSTFLVKEWSNKISTILMNNSVMQISTCAQPIAVAMWRSERNWSIHTHCWFVTIHPGTPTYHVIE